MATHPNGDDDDETERHEVDPAPSPFDTAQDTSDFSQDRKEMAAKLDEELPTYINDEFGVPHEDIHHVDSLNGERYERSDAFRLAEVLDFTGIDRIVDEKDRVFGVGCRVRPNKPNRTDFSIRCDNGVDGIGSEHDNILNAVKNGGIYPTYYLYGIYNDSMEFDKVHLIEIRRMMYDVISGALEPTATNTVNEGKATAHFYDMGTLDDHGFVKRTWDFSDAEADTTE